MLKAINIISFDVPFPANYGGIIDVFYKLKYFHQKGIKIYLHCFEYGKGKQKELEKYCVSVKYYQRKTGIISLLSSTPYIVKSRVDKRLKRNLLKNNFPILFEGLHTCFLLNDDDLKNRVKLFRESNIEHEYYHNLANAEKNPFKKIFFKIEAKKLKKFESIVKNAAIGFVVSTSDLAYFQQKYATNKFVFLPSFHPNETVNIKAGKGKYVLYHGNLSVAENSHAAEFIIKNIFTALQIPLIVAGLNPPKYLVQLIQQHQNITLIKNPSDNKMHDLIANAQINFLYTHQATGLKLKLLNVLYNGRHCVLNSNMVTGTSLGEICLVADKIAELKKIIATTFNIEFNNLEIAARKSVLARYSNENNFISMLAVIKTKF